MKSYNCIICILCFFLILFLGIYFLSKCKKEINEPYENIYVYDTIYITNNINNNIIVITSMNVENGVLQNTINNNGLTIYLTSSNINSSPSYFTYLKFLLNGQIDIVDIQSANGQYWYFNYKSSQGEMDTAGSSCSNSSSLFKPIDLTTVPSSHIFQNGILFQNGSIITFDITGNYIVFENQPQLGKNNFIQAIFNLGDINNNNRELVGNNMVLLNTNMTIPTNYYYYNGSCTYNDSGANPSDGASINNVETRGIYISSSSQSIIQFNNGCFIDGTLSGSTIRFIGINGVIQFVLSGNYDILQIWNLIQSKYLYYNTSNTADVDLSSSSIYVSSQSNQNYWDKINNGLLPYTPFTESQIYNNSLQYSYIDQIIIYNPNSTNNNAILIQVDSAYYSPSMGNSLPQGTNNNSISINSIIYDSATQKIKTNPNALSRFLFNFNNAQGDLVNFTNGQYYFYYNYTNNSGNLPINSGTTTINLGVNNISNGSSKTIPTSSNPYAFRNSPPNVLVFENNLNFTGGLQIGIDNGGNCIWKGSSGQIEFILNSYTQGSNNLNIFALNSNGTINYNLNSFTNKFSNIASLSTQYIQPNQTPSTLVSSSITNIINGNSVELPISKLLFSNGMMMASDNTNLYIQGIFGSFLATLNSSSGNFIQFQNNSWGNPGSALTLQYPKVNSTTTNNLLNNISITTPLNGSNFSIINSTTGSGITNNITQGILHYISQWESCGISGTSVNPISITETSGDYIVGKGMSIDTDLTSETTYDNKYWPCSSVTPLNPIANNLIVTFPNGYIDSNGNSIIEGGVCVLEPIGGIIHYISSFGDCGITDQGVKTVQESSGNLLVGQNMSTQTNSTSTDISTGWPCSSVSALNPVQNNLIVSFPNGYTDVNGNSIVRGGNCVIEPVYPEFLSL